MSRTAELCDVMCTAHCATVRSIFRECGCDCSRPLSSNAHPVSRSAMSEIEITLNLRAPRCRAKVRGEIEFATNSVSPPMQPVMPNFSRRRTWSRSRGPGQALDSRILELMAVWGEWFDAISNVLGTTWLNSTGRSVLASRSEQSLMIRWMEQPSKSDQHSSDVTVADVILLERKFIERAWCCS